MKKIFFTFLFLFAFLGGGISSYAQTNNPKGQALEKFTQKQYDLLFKSNLSDMSNEYGDIFTISKKVDIFSNMADEAGEERKDAQDSVTNVLLQITNLKQSMKIIDFQISRAKEQVVEANKGIAVSKRKIKENQEEIEGLREQIDESTNVLLEYLDYMYKKSNTSFEQGELDNIKSILLNNEDISDLVNDLYYNSLIQIAGQELIAEHKSLITDLYRKKVELDKEKRDFAMLRKEQILATNNLDDKRKFKENLLKISRGEQKIYEKYLDKQVAIEKKLKITAIKEQIKLATIKQKIFDKYDCEFIDFEKDTAVARAMKVNAPKCYNINRMIYLEKQLATKGKIAAGDEQKKKNPLTWPVSPLKGITAYYKDAGYKKLFGADHNAIDVRLAQGSPIRAPMDGYVLYVNKPETLDYSFVAIKHYDGYITVYGHLSELMVEQYDFVNKGEIFAKSGGEYGTKGAGYISTGPHLHFEVFRNKEYIDPLTVLDTSLLSYNDLPNERLRLKYLFDFKARKGYDYASVNTKARMFNVVGDNEIERQQNFLKMYARADFSDWQMWVDEALAGDIDPSLIMCIGLAESSLGKNLTTAYNIGNVGNNDRGDRVGVSGPQMGIRSIVKTLNNKYFRGYRRLDKLSGAGRIISGLPSCKVAGEYCYATDPRHWHPNVVRCMSHLKGEVVSNDYNFRLK